MARKQNPDTTPEAEANVTDAEKEARTKSYAYADTTLRNKYEDEFNSLRKEFMSNAGYPDWEPRSVVSARKAEAKAAQDRAKAETALAKLLAEHPYLAQSPAVSPVPEPDGAEGQEGASEAQSA